MNNYESIYESFKEGDVIPFYDNLYPGLLTYASRQLGNDLAYLAEDCVQEAVMNSYKMRKSLNSSFAWYSYILKCIYHSALQQIRKYNSGIRYAETEEIDTVSPQLDVEILEQEIQDALYSAIRTLPAKYQELLRMSFIEGLKNAEIAQRLNVAEITVKKQKAKLLKLLRDKLDGCSPSVIILIIELLGLDI